MAATKKVDYDRIEPGWRAGIASPRQLAAQYTEETGQPVSHTAIISHFKKAGIDRDLSAKIQAKAEAMVTEAMVTGKVTAKPTIPEKQVIEDGAVKIAEVRIAHRADIRRARGVVNNLLIELESQTGGDAAATLEQLGELMRKPDDKGMDKLNDLYQKVISLPGRAKTMKDLGESLRVLIGLERQAFGMNDKGDDEPPPGFGGKSLTDVERAVRLMHFMGAGARP